MIKIDKDISRVPRSLMLPTAANFPQGIPLPPQTTHARRMEVIVHGSYINEDKYNARYKLDDIKDALKDIYFDKCAYCEQYIEQSHVEHYRPKDIYYWLAYSWDNLIVACATCNQFKGTNFQLKGTSVAFVNNPDNVSHIHSSSAGYDVTEQPNMVNPEATDSVGKIRFLRNGKIESDDEAFAYTIKTCHIDRHALNDLRRTIINTFKEDIISVLLESKNLKDQLVAIGTVVSKFIRDSKNEKSTFLAYKRFVIANGWLNEIIKEAN